MTTPNRVADAAELLEKFILRQDWIVAEIDSGNEDAADDRAAVIAIQLLAIASQLERIGDAQERSAVATEALALTLATATSPGKTRPAAWLLDAWNEVKEDETGGEAATL